MKVGYDEMNGKWFWVINDGPFYASGCYYTRRRDAIRGFERFCAAIRGMKA